MRVKMAAADSKDSHRRRNRLHPDSIFEQRRYSFSNCGGGRQSPSQQQQQQQRRGSHDRCQPAEEGRRSPAIGQRRASYDVSFLKRVVAPPHPADEVKSTRRDSLVRR